MQQIINFIIRYKNLLLYLLLLIISLGFTINAHSYHRSRFLNSANWVSGSIFQTSDNITTYFQLGAENKKLLEENRKLRLLLSNRQIKDTVAIDSASLHYKIIAGRVIKNSYANPRNYITIDKGEDQGIGEDMGVITATGILGIIENTSANFSTVQSILNIKSNINAKIKNTNHFGSLVWNAKDYNTVQLMDIPRLVQLNIGDTIVTGAMSSIFPENIPIGVIKKFDLNVQKSFYSIDVALFNDMTGIKNIYVINNLERPEIKALESETKNGQ
ncbi:rod shape-determining protein MreC [Flavobacteriaceae bacterium F89]|uniref:Cell shape-determining protein MreC n=1 Tax=Cerina litoralis TaxID=2874477 RepID=A0AAE3EZN9_9FLAO|nr:rod shape-determining protein MreC [Cerina litoralis]MCG2462701.1 rod shape-determining protein MreC [Cerina litoralis]